VFSEYSKGNLLQGRVTLKNCNPIKLLGVTGAQGTSDINAAPGSTE
jgi:hypothetical protein